MSLENLRYEIFLIDGISTRIITNLAGREKPVDTGNINVELELKFESSIIRLHSIQTYIKCQITQNVHK
jgi:hypothetical protein